MDTEIRRFVVGAPAALSYDVFAGPAGGRSQ